MEAELIKGEFAPGLRCEGGPLAHAWQTHAFFARRPFAVFGTWRWRSIESAFGMNVANEMGIGRKVGQYALAAIGAVAGDEDFIMRKPRCHQGNQFDRELRPGPVIGIGFAFGGLVLVLFPLGEPLAVTIEPEGDRQGKDFAGSPEGVNDQQTEDDPVVAPTDQRFGSARNQGIMMHAAAIKS